LAVKGYLDIAIDPSLDLFDEIRKLKKEKMQSFSLIITKRVRFRILQILLVIVFNYHKKQRAQVLT
jgi:hypothetical protein